MTSSEIDTLIDHAARGAMHDGCIADAGPQGDLARWVRLHCHYRPGTEFFVVLLVAARIADLHAQAEGYQSSAHRAAALAFQTKD